MAMATSAAAIATTMADTRLKPGEVVENDSALAYTRLPRADTLSTVQNAVVRMNDSRSSDCTCCAPATSSTAWCECRR